MFQLFADTLPMMLFAILVAAVFYVPGLWIVVVAMKDKRVWVEDANGGIHRRPHFLSE